MDKNNPDSLKVFDGDKFPIWKFYMENNFDAKDILRVVDGTIPKPPVTASEADKAAWNKANALAKSMISSAVSFTVLENLVNCADAPSMWATLCSFYQQKSKENIYMV